MCNESYLRFTEYHLIQNVSSLFVLFGSRLALKPPPESPLENTCDYIAAYSPAINTIYGIIFEPVYHGHAYVCMTCLNLAASICFLL